MSSIDVLVLNNNPALSDLYKGGLTTMNGTYMFWVEEEQFAMICEDQTPNLVDTWSASFSAEGYCEAGGYSNEPAENLPMSRAANLLESPAQNFSEPGANLQEP